MKHLFKSTCRSFLLSAVTIWQGGMIFSHAAEANDWSKPDQEERIILENADAKVVIWPYAGGSITEYLNKKTGTNYVAGEVKPGESRFGWADVARAGNQDPNSEWFGSLPYEVRRVDTDVALAVELRCISQGLEVSRVVALDRSSPQLHVTVRQKNVSDAPRRLYPRWHPYMMIDDPFAEHSAIYFPDAGENIRKIKTGQGWDGQFLEPGGFIMAANWETGEGLWITFEKEKMPLLETWTDYKHNKKHPLRGAFTVEPLMPPVLKGPEEEVELKYNYFPFTKETPASELASDLLKEPSTREEAKRFLTLVRPNLKMIALHTMIPEPNKSEVAIEQNRFFFKHRRRDRMALRPWGIADAMFAVGGKQSIPGRLRFTASAFPDLKDTEDLMFRFFVEDASGERVMEEDRSTRLSPSSPTYDERVEVDLSKLDDGTYTVGVEVFEKGNFTPIHFVTETRRLIGKAWDQLSKVAPAGLNERPFVTALRKEEFKADSLSDLSLPIGVENAASVAWKHWPLTVGVPFPKSLVQKDTALILKDPAGKEVAFDSRVAATWEDGSVRWLLLDFAADVPAKGFVFYQLEAGKSTLAASPLLLTQEGESIRFDNGLKQWQWSPSDKGGDLGPLQGSNLWWTDGAGHRYQFALRGEGAGLKIEQNGTQHAVVRATGWYYAEGVDKPVARGILRFEGYAQQRQLKIEHNVLFAGDAWHQTLASYGLRFAWKGTPAKNVTLDVDGKDRKIAVPFSLLQKGANRCEIDSNGKITIGHRVVGAFAIGTGSETRTLLFLDFWRLHPKGVRMENGSSITFSYWPEEEAHKGFLPREDGWLPSSASPEAIAVGMSRTHTFILLDGEPVNLQTVSTLWEDPPLAILPPRYLAETKTMMHLQPYAPDRYPEIEQIISTVFDTYFLNAKIWEWNGEWAYGGIPNAFLDDEYRWANFGRYGTILNELDIVQSAWLAYLRSGDRKYLRFAEANTRHLMEVGSIGWNDTWPEMVGMSRRHHECIWLGAGDYGHTMLDPYLEMYHTTGYTPAWEAALATADGMMRQRTGEWRYISNPLAGLSRMYLETQNPIYKEQADRIWKDLCYPDQNTWWLYAHGCRAVMYYSQINPECEKIWLDWTLKEKDRFTGWDALSALYLKTHDIKYADAVSTQFQKSGFFDAMKQKDFDPLLTPISWRGEMSTPGLTQGYLNHLRELCYVGSTLEAAKKVEQVKEEK